MELGPVASLRMDGHPQMNTGLERAALEVTREGRPLPSQDICPMEGDSLSVGVNVHCSVTHSWGAVYEGSER